MTSRTRNKQTQTMKEEIPSPPPSVLQKAHEIIHGDREQAYGSPQKNSECIAVYWSEHLHQAHGIEVDLTAQDVCAMMILLKVARLGSNPTHIDSLVDVAGYAGLAERCM